MNEKELQQAREYYRNYPDYGKTFRASQLARNMAWYRNQPELDDFYVFCAQEDSKELSVIRWNTRGEYYPNLASSPKYPQRARPAWINMNPGFTVTNSYIRELN